MSNIIKGFNACFVLILSCYKISTSNFLMICHADYNHYDSSKCPNKFQLTKISVSYELWITLFTHVCTWEISFTMQGRHQSHKKLEGNSHKNCSIKIKASLSIKAESISGCIFDVDESLKVKIKREKI